jgi:hypothetical protein
MSVLSSRVILTTLHGVRCLFGLVTSVPGTLQLRLSIRVGFLPLPDFQAPDRPYIERSRDEIMRRHCLPIERLRAWATLNGVKFDGTRVERITNLDGQHEGAGLFAARDFGTSQDSETFLLSVPHELVLSVDLVHDYAKSDGHLRDVLEAVGEFGRVCKMYGIRLFACAAYKLTCNRVQGARY